MIASSFACVASDVLGPAAEAHIAELTLFYTHARMLAGPNYTHTQNLCMLSTLWKQPKQPHQRKSLEYVRVCFYLNLKLVRGDFMDHTHKDSLCLLSCDSLKSSGLNLFGHSIISALAKRGF